MDNYRINMDGFDSLNDYEKRQIKEGAGIHVHVGRGGRFYNQGYHTIEGLLEDLSDYLLARDWIYRYDSIDEYIEGFDEDDVDSAKEFYRKYENDGVLVLGTDGKPLDCFIDDGLLLKVEFDGDYDTDYITTFDELEELGLVEEIDEEEQEDGL